MDRQKRQTFGNNAVRRIRSFVFGKRKETDLNNNCSIPSGSIRLLLGLTDTKSTSQNDNTQQQKKDEEQKQHQHQQQKKYDEQKQHQHQQQERKEKEGQSEIKIPFSIFLKCAKNSLSTKAGRQQLYWESYRYFWNYLFGRSAAKARMAEEDYYNDFYNDFDDEEFY